MKFENLSRRGEEIPSYCLPRKSESYDASSECCWTNQAGKASDRLKLVSRAALPGCILLSLELIVDILTTVLRATP